jgi:hypothetical protein
MKEKSAWFPRDISGIGATPGQTGRFALPVLGRFVFAAVRFWFSLAWLVCGALSSFGAEHFGDIDITPITIASGETHHGYREFRILVENRSLKNTHQVTLVYPDKSYNSGNSISRLSRTVAIGPSASALVPLWQPPLPVNGNSQMRVLVDNDELGSLNLPDAARHATGGGYSHPGYGYYRPGPGPGAPTTILVSRSLNFDELNRAFNSKAGAAGYSAQMAAGAPDSGGRFGTIPTAWAPDPSFSGPQWLELDYANPQPASGLRIYSTVRLLPGTQIFVKGVSGTNLFQTNTPALGGGRLPTEEFNFPMTSQPVKTVRLEFAGGSWGSIGIDAAELIGSSNSTWAASAHASSEATSYAGSAGSGGLTRGLLRSELPMSQWSEAWLSYTPYDGIALNESDVKSLPPAAFNALWSYLECGGNLFIFGAESVPDPWRTFSKASVDYINYVDCRNVGLGRCFAFKQDKITALTTGETKIMTDAADLTARYWMSLPDEGSANQSFPVIQNIRVPVRSAVFLMLLFILAIGPANLIVVSKMNRRTWLLWTIPAISLFTSLSVFAYSYLREGITPDTRISGVTVLDQANRRAASVGYTAFYCPLTPSQGLFFSSETEATPLVETWDYRNGMDRELDWTQSQHLGRGWVSARVPAHFELRKAETRRERLEVENVNGQWTVVNGLGAAIQSLWLADGASRVYTATNVAAGQKASLVATTNFLKQAEQLGARALLEKCGPQADLADATTYLLPNTYIAELNANPFLENGLGPRAQSARTKAHTVVYGMLEAPAKP